MPALDWVFLAVLLASMLLGAWRGLVYEVLSLLTWLLAFLLAQWLAPEVAQRLPMTGANDMMRYAAGFVVVFVAAVMLGGLITALVKKLVSTVGLRPVDRVLGAVFGLARGVLLLLLAVVLVSMTPLESSATWQESRGAGLAGSLLNGLKPVLPPDLGRLLPTQVIQ